MKCGMRDFPMKDLNVILNKKSDFLQSLLAKITSIGINTGDKIKSQKKLESLSKQERIIKNVSRGKQCNFKT